MFGFDFETPRLGSEMKQDWLTSLKMKFNPKWLFIVPIILIPALLFKTLVPIALLMALTITVSYVGQKTKLKRFGLELVTFTTIITGVSFGAIPGILAGMSLIAMHDIITKRIGMYWIIVMPLFGVIGALASLYSGANILFLGVGLTIMSHLVFMAFQSITSEFPARYLFYMLLNIFLNAFLFYRFAPIFI